jgi:hypothetical protein
MYVNGIQQIRRVISDFILGDRPQKVFDICIVSEREYSSLGKFRGQQRLHPWRAFVFSCLRLLSMSCKAMHEENAENRGLAISKLMS